MIQYPNSNSACQFWFLYIYCVSVSKKLDEENLSRVQKRKWDKLKVKVALNAPFLQNMNTNFEIFLKCPHIMIYSIKENMWNKTGKHQYRKALFHNLNQFDSFSAYSMRQRCYVWTRMNSLLLILYVKLH